MVLHLSAAHFPASFQVLGRDSPSASVEKAWQDVPRMHRVPPPLAAQEKVAFQTDLRDAFLQAPLAAEHQAQPSAAPSMTAGESVWVPEA